MAGPSAKVSHQFTINPQMPNEVYMYNIAISSPSVNILPDVEFDHKDYGVSEELFNRLNHDVWLKMMKIYSEVLTPSQKHYFLNSMKSDEERIKAFKDYVRVKKNLGHYFKVYDERFQDSKSNVVFELRDQEKQCSKLENPEIPELKEPQSKEALVKNFREHPEAFKMMKKTGALVNDTFNVTVFSRGPTFRVIDKIERSKLTYLDDKGVEKDLLRDKDENYTAYEGTYDLAGPHLCTYDAKVLCALFLIHTNGVKQGLRLETSFTEIAKQLQRTEGSIKTRLIVKALTLVDEDHSITLDDAAARFKITTQDIQVYQANKKKRQHQRMLNHPVNLQMIYAKLLDIESKLT